MLNKKTIDFIIAIEVFLLAILEFISWKLWLNDDFNGTTVASEYMLFYYPLLTTIGFLIVGIGKILKCYRFKVCIYTIIVSWLFTIIQIFNLLSLFCIDFELYNEIINPLFIFSIIGLILLKLLRWVSQRR